MASEAEIKKRIAALKEEAEVNRQLYESDNRRIKALEKSQQAVEEILTLEQKLTSEYKDIKKCS